MGFVNKTITDGDHFNKQNFIKRVPIIVKVITSFPNLSQNGPAVFIVRIMLSTVGMSSLNKAKWRLTDIPIIREWYPT